MGKAVIVSGGTDGLYTVRPVHNRERLDAEIARIEASIDDLESARLDLQAALLDAQDAVTQAREALDAEVAWSIESGDNSTLAPASENLLRAATFRNQAESNLALNTAQLITGRLELSRLRVVPADQTQAAWCADLTENLTGEVATAEIPGEGNARLIVRPGYDGRATYSAIRDGQLFHRAGMSPAQVYFNAAILPGWQKWKPTYRVGTLTAVDAGTDTGSVALDSEESSAQDLLINQSGTLTSIPVQYMGCNASAFEVGDRVIVEFVGQNQGSPRVIGFESNPKECVCPGEFFVTFGVKLDDPAYPGNDELVFNKVRGFTDTLTCQVGGNGWSEVSLIVKYYRSKHFVVTDTTLDAWCESDFGAPTAEDPFFAYSVVETNDIGGSADGPAEWTLLSGDLFRVRKVVDDHVGPITLLPWNSCSNSRTGYYIYGTTQFLLGGIPPDPPLGKTVTELASFTLTDYASRQEWSQDVITWLVANTSLPAEVTVGSGAPPKVFEIDPESFENMSPGYSRIRYIEK